MPEIDTSKPRPIVFLWDNFGPMHDDRCAAVAVAQPRLVIGLEIFSQSDTYEWVNSRPQAFSKVTLLGGGVRKKKLTILFKLVVTAFHIGRADWFLCHYERFEVFILACLLRLTMQNVFTMADAKFDDRPRSLMREVGKSLFFLPYSGAIGCGKRSRDYLRFLGIPETRIFGEYNTLSIDRIRSIRTSETQELAPEFSDRFFLIVARLVPKKNIQMALRAYAKWASTGNGKRDLVICGAGPLQNELDVLAKELGIAGSVRFMGFLQAPDIARLMRGALVLLLPSVEEQFGLVVIEAQALGLPVIVSDNCGARDLLVRNGISGFVIEPDNPDGMAWFMNHLSQDYDLWQSMSAAALQTSAMGDVSNFVQAVKMLTVEKALKP